MAIEFRTLWLCGLAGSARVLAALGVTGLSFIAEAPLANQAQAPQARGHFCMTYDSKSGVTVVSGGVATGGGHLTFLDDYWTWDGSTWRSKGRTGLRVMGARATFDTRRNRVVMMGGLIDGKGPSGELRAWSENQWVVLSQLPGTTTADPGLAYDSIRDRTVALVPEPSSKTMLTYEWNGSEWRTVGARGLAVSDGATVQFDPKRGKTVLFGGWKADGTLSQDLWEYDGIRWQKSAAAGPSARMYPALTFDEKLGVVILHGGMGLRGVRFADTWKWDGAQWAKLSENGPDIESCIAYDSLRSRTVLVGCASHDVGAGSLEVWEWDGTKWLRIPPR